MVMENIVKKILTDFRSLKHNENQFKNNILEFSRITVEQSTANTNPPSTNVLDTLDKSFKRNYEQLLEKLSSKCKPSSYATNAGKRSSSFQDMHKDGNAIDISYPANSPCFCEILNICANNFSGKLFCQNQDQNYFSDPNYVGPHIHVQVHVRGNETQSCVNNTNNTSYTPIEKDTGYDKTVLAPLAAGVGIGAMAGALSEDYSFGKSSTQYFNTVTIPASENKKIYSPTSGFVNNSRYFRGCNNQLAITTENGQFTYVFCNISNFYVEEGEKVNSGTPLGRVEEDVTLVVYDKNMNKINPKKIDSYSGQNKRNTPKDSKDKSGSNTKTKYGIESDKGVDYLRDKKGNYESDDIYRKVQPEPEYEDPALAMLGNALVSPLRFVTSPFRDKYDKKTGKLIRKGLLTNPTDKVQPEPFYKSLKEDINRIKKLIK